LNLVVPIGEWKVVAELDYQLTTNASAFEVYTAISTSSSAPTADLLGFGNRTLLAFANTTSAHIIAVHKVGSVTATAATPVYLLIQAGGGSAFTVLHFRGVITSAPYEATYVTAELEYV
jgi:hypothetical protein